MPDASISVSEAARFLGIEEEEARELADPGGRVPLEAVRSRVGAATLALQLARAREEVGRLSGQLEEVRASNARLQKEMKESIEERRRLTQEVLELRAAAEERLMLMERIEHMARVEKELEESSSEIERLKNRRLLDRLLNR
jgi:predicted RNase H-like nuclease (RuvC/YqgF family)